MELKADILDGRFVRLEPLSEAVQAPVGAALASDPEAWKVMVSHGGPGGFTDWWAAAMAGMAAGTVIVYALRRLADGEIVGTSGYHSLRLKHRGVEIGGTFYRPDARGGPVNPEAKRLLLAHAFEAGAVRVEFVTDALNVRSRAAIEKLGAHPEGILRKHKITWTGRVRDTAIYSIVAEEWPEIRDRLDTRLAAFDG